MGRTIQWHQMDGSPIIVTENVLEYRKCITEHISNEDVCIEVGCAEGLTTSLIAQQARQAFGIDKSDSQIAKARARNQQQANLSFHQMDAWDLNSVLKLAAAANVQFNVVFIDVSGSRRVGDVDNLLMKYEQVFNPRLFVVKSYQLKRLINRCQLYQCTAKHKQQAAVAAAATDAQQHPEARASEAQPSCHVAPRAELQVQTAAESQHTQEAMQGGTDGTTGGRDNQGS